MQIHRAVSCLIRVTWPRKGIVVVDNTPCQDSLRAVFCTADGDCTIGRETVVDSATVVGFVWSQQLGFAE